MGEEGEEKKIKQHSDLAKKKRELCIFLVPGRCEFKGEDLVLMEILRSFPATLLPS